MVTSTARGGPVVQLPGAPSGRSGQVGRRPWLPASLTGLQVQDLPEGTARYDEACVGQLRYVEVHELVGSFATLAASPWPEADEKGRLRFTGSGERGHLVVHRAELEAVLYLGWRQRQPRVGDVFAARIEAQADERLACGEDVVCDDSLRLGSLLLGPVHDISADARVVGKLAYFAAGAACQSLGKARALGQLDLVENPPSGPAPTRRLAVEWDGAVVPGGTDDAWPDGPPWAVPEDQFVEDDSVDFQAELRANRDALIYFLLNVGDGDTQLILLPPDRRTRRRRAVVVDVATKDKLPQLLEALAELGELTDLHARDLFPVVVATHPHDDHIGGMADFLDRYGRSGQVSDYWEPGFYHSSGTFAETMAMVEDLGLTSTQPTSGTTRWTGAAKLTVVAPGVGLRTRFDSYGVGVNDASIALKVDFPAARVAASGRRGAGERVYLRQRSPWCLLLGADAQTSSWAQASTDFPQLHRTDSSGLYAELSAARGRDHLAADVLKVPHHASKHGLNLELVERVRPQVALISSVGGQGKYNFPHRLALDALREALQPSTSRQTARRADHELGIHYTGSHLQGQPCPEGTLGSIALVVPPKRGVRLRMWRFGDGPRQPVDLSRGRRMKQVRAPS